jgi:hypothetical protein
MYARSVIKDPKIALTEIVANAWDAGATKVSITWPNEEVGGSVSVEDNGCGMTFDEFKQRWTEASYDRTEKQGDTITLPDGSVRKVFGRNGMGRFGMFYFSDTYKVSTWKDGTENTFAVVRDSTPFHIEHLETKEKRGSGTIVSCIRDKATSVLVDANAIESWLQDKFFNSSNFDIKLNGKSLTLNICKLVDQQTVTLSNGKDVIITRYELPEKSKKGGVLFRVKNRPVGEPDWSLLKYAIDPKKDGVSGLLITVDVDFLESSVEPDWTAFKKTDEVKKILRESLAQVEYSIKDVVNNVRHNRKKAAVRKNLVEIRKMSNIQHKDLDSFLQSVLDNCPSLTDEDLSKILESLVNMEQSNSKYSLMDKLSKITPDNIDDLDDILSEWSVADAKIVFKEISERIKVLEKMEDIVNDKETLEVQVLQPLIGRNLWIFGPEFDSCSFTSNKSITTVMRDLFGAKMESDSHRPDFVILPNEGTVGFYSADSYDYRNSSGEPRGLSKIVIVELKKGGYSIGLDEMTQAIKYAVTLKNTGRINGSPEYLCYVVGSKIDQGVGEQENKPDVLAIPIQYDALIRAADARLLGIRHKIEESFEFLTNLDNDVTETVKEYPDLSDILGSK